MGTLSGRPMGTALRIRRPDWQRGRRERVPGTALVAGQPRALHVAGATSAERQGTHMCLCVACDPPQAGMSPDGSK
jgi:hypothetical protein